MFNFFKRYIFSKHLKKDEKNIEFFMLQTFKIGSIFSMKNMLCNFLKKRFNENLKYYDNNYAWSYLDKNQIFLVISRPKIHLIENTNRFCFIFKTLIDDQVYLIRTNVFDGDNRMTDQYIIDDIKINIKEF